MKAAKKRNTIYTFSTTLLILSMLCGCQSSYTKQFQTSEDNYGSRTGSELQINEGNRMYGPTIMGGKNHHNKKLSYSQDLSAALSDMSGIFTGIVMETNKNAYAAIIFDNSATGTKGQGTPDESDHTGTTRGMYDTFTGNQYADPNEIATGINSYYTEKDPHRLSSLLKQRIADTLRKQNPRLLEVYISANREFVNQMNVYYIESQRGVDLNGYLEDFNKLVSVHFGITP
jgi:hypothetical protein